MCQIHQGQELGDFRATSLNTLLQMVASGQGVTLLPSMAVEAEVARNDRIKVRPFQKPAPGRRIGLFWRKSAPRGRDYRTLGELLRAHAPRGAAPAN